MNVLCVFQSDISYNQLLHVFFISVCQIDPKDFKHTVDEINRMFVEAESLSGRTYCESCFACLTAYLSYLCFDTYYEKVRSVNTLVLSLISYIL